jgi:hypothetical protein
MFTFGGENIIPETRDQKFLERIVDEFNIRVL